MTQTAPVTDLDFSEAEMEAHVARFRDMQSTSKSFIDTRLPGHERDIYTIIAGGTPSTPARPPPAPAATGLPPRDHPGRARQGRGAAFASHAGGVHAAVGPLGHLLGAAG